jgi:hypothetical protein
MFNKQQKAEYAKTHRTEIAKRMSEYRAAHRAEILKQRAEYREVHRAENTWHNMHQRAENKNGSNPAYANVHVCKRWSGPKGKDNFVKDMGQPPKGTTLGRILDRGNYELGNAFWMTRDEQRLNKCNNAALRKWVGEHREHRSERHEGHRGERHEGHRR